jgi:hypothetical protein
MSPKQNNVGGGPTGVASKDNEHWRDDIGKTAFIPLDVGAKLNWIEAGLDDNGAGDGKWEIEEVGNA